MGGVSADRTIEGLRAENEMLHAMLARLLEVAELEPIDPAAIPAVVPEVWEPCRFPLPPGCYARIRGGEPR